MNAALTLGVIGHVDHGKTALVRALTGIETDRLREERERGLSIVLGFAYLETANGAVDLIDVPGHEDFIRAMIAGATALDGVVLCIAANEAVMPQTVEHFSIARLLGVRRGCVAITKTDLVDATALARVQREIDDFVRGSFLEGAPRLEVSTATGAGIAAAKQALAGIAALPVAHADDGPFFLPLDRVFTLRGFGLVVTGTLRGGPIRVGDSVELMPAGRSATVRALQNHGEAIEAAWPGQRVAVNLRQLDRDAVAAGDVLATPGSLAPTRRLDVAVELLASASALKNGAQVRCLTGTIEAMARLRLLDRAVLDPGATAMAQLNLDRSIATRVHEPCLVRGVSPMRTLGGGRILALNATRHRRFDATVTARLESLAAGDFAGVLRQRLAAAGAAGIDLGELARELGRSVEAMEAALPSSETLRIGANLVVAEKALEELASQILAALERFHAEHRLRSGLDAGSLAGRLAAPPNPEVFRHALRGLVRTGRVRSDREVLCIANHDPFAGLGEREIRLVRGVESAFLESGLEPPAMSALVPANRTAAAVLRLLLEAGRLVRLRTYQTDSDLVLHADVVQNAKRAIEQKFPYPQAFALKDVRDLFGSTRKYIVPLMEHFDATGTTVRSGDLRRLRQQ